MTDYEMFSRQGNRRVQQAVTTAVTATVAGEDPTPTKAARILKHRVNRIAEKHPEVYDTAVREAIWNGLREGYQALGQADPEGLANSVYGKWMAAV